MDSPAFELIGVSKQFDGAVVLAPTDLVVGRGEVFVLIGPSGCGKSTLLKLLNGLLKPDTGMIRFFGSNVTPAAAGALRRRMGYGLQGGALFPHLTARGNVTLLARHLKWPSARISQRLEVLLELTRLPADALDRFPAQLSGGQAQRVGLMRALMLDPDVLLLDEPLGALDPMTRFELQAELREVFSRLKKTVLLVTHDLGEAAYFSERLVLMRAGQVVQQGSLDTLASSPANDFVTRFVQAQRSPRVARS